MQGLQSLTQWRRKDGEYGRHGWRSHLGENSAGGGQCAALRVVMVARSSGRRACRMYGVGRREAGVLLLAVPIGFLPDSVLAEGALRSEESIFGPRKVFKVASLLEEGGILAQTGVYIDVLVVDCAAEI